MSKPWVGIPTRYDEKNKRFTQDRYYLDALNWAGSVPVLIPVGSDQALIAEYADKLDAVFLPGSPTDIDPVHYGREPHEKLGRVFADRDRTDFLLLDIAECHNLPVLGICYGAQSLNVYRGGSLIQDIPSEIPAALAHDLDGEPKEIKSHAVRLSEKGWLRRLNPAPGADVNSYHHQAIDVPGKNLGAVATAPDGVVEAVEDDRGRFTVGVQWHPETGWQTDSFARALFSAFVEAGS